MITFVAICIVNSDKHSAKSSKDAFSTLFICAILESMTFVIGMWVGAGL